MEKPDILIVDDEIGIRESLKLIINERIEAEIEEKEDGDSALEVISSKKFDLILTDLNMPYTRGITLLEEIRKIDNDVPVIAITAWEYTPYILSKIESLNISYVPKPMPTELLKNMIMEILEKKGKLIKK